MHNEKFLLSRSEKNRVITDHHGFIRSRAVTFWKYNKRLDIDDCVQEAMLAALDAVERWDPKKGAFSTWVQLCIGSHLKDYAKKSAKHIDQKTEYEEWEHPVERDHEGELDERRLFSGFAEHDVLVKRAQGKTLEEIAQEEGVHRSTILRRQQKALAAAIEGNFSEPESNIPKTD